MRMMRGMSREAEEGLDEEQQKMSVDVGEAMRALYKDGCSLLKYGTDEGISGCLASRKEPNTQFA